MDTQVFPYVSAELIRALEERFPQRSPQKHESHEDLVWRGGQCSVVDFLRAEHDDQHRDQLEGDP